MKATYHGAMFEEHKILAVVPARGGSRGVPMKNIHPLLGKPLIGWTAECIASVPMIDQAVVSTDHKEIAAVAESFGLRAPFRRPHDLSGDKAGDLGVLFHALETMEAMDRCRYDIVVMLQPTAPLRRAQDVNGTIKHLVEGGYDAVWTVTETDLKYHPHKQLMLDDGLLHYAHEEGKKMLPRQMLQPCFHVNGVVYALTRECILEQKNRLGKRTGAFVLEGPSVSIDTLEDFRMVEDILSRRT